MKILTLDKYNNSSHPTFEAKVSDCNTLAKKALLALDPDFKKIFDGTSQEFKRIKLDGHQVNIRLKGWADTDKIAIEARSCKNKNHFGVFYFSPSKEIGTDYHLFMVDVRSAVDKIRKNPNYIKSKFKKIEKMNNNNFSIQYEDSARKKLSLLGGDFVEALKTIPQIINKKNHPPLSVIVGGYGDRKTVAMIAHFREKTYPFGHAAFTTKKANGDNEDIKGFIKSIRQAIKKLKEKEKRRIKK